MDIYTLLTGIGALLGGIGGTVGMQKLRLKKETHSDLEPRVAVLEAQQERLQAQYDQIIPKIDAIWKTITQISQDLAVLRDRLGRPGL